MEFDQMQARAQQINKLMHQFERTQNVPEWGTRQLTMGFVGDVGALVKLVQAKLGDRHIDDVDDKLRHEIADCLWSIIVIADSLDIDLQSAFMDTMDKLENRITNRSSDSPKA